MNVAGERSAWLVAAASVAACFAGSHAGLGLDLPHAWLAAVVTALAWPLGSIGLLLIHALTGGRWGEHLRPALTAGVSALPLLLLAALPLAAWLSVLYPWMHPGAPMRNGFYLNLPFFCVRLALYAATWLALHIVTVRALRRPDSPAALRAWAPAGLIVLALTLTFAAIDLTMSLEPEFSSSVYGLIAISAAALLALSVAVLITAVNRQEVDPNTARLLLGLTLLWAYLDFMQWLIVWQSDLAGDAPWYVRRSSGVWGATAVWMSALHFALPFALLLCPSLRRSRRGCAAVAGLLIAGEFVRAWWLVLPAASLTISWIDASAMLAFVALTTAWYLRCARHGTDG